MANILIAYFSMKGQTIGPGMRIINQDKGNTQMVAEYIQNAVDGELFEIVPDKTYSTDHMALIEEAKQELNAGTRVPVKAYPDDVRRYDTVFIGFPNWWNSLPMPVVTFLENIDLSGKKVIPFITSEGSGWGSTLSEIKDIVKNAEFGEGLSLQGSKTRTSEKKVGEWAKNRFKEESAMNNQTSITLNNGSTCPVIGIGTFMLSPAEAENSVREALKMGYSLVDTANAYVNERACGRGIKASGVKREDVFISTKLWPSEYENLNAVDETLERLGVDYVDLLYIHQPAGNWLVGYRQLEKACRDGKAKAIGISNFEGKYIAELETKWEIVPQFIQVEAHPYFTQSELRVTLDKYGIKLMSWYPLGHGDKSLINEPVFAKLGEKYGKTPAQVILRWHTQMGFVVIPGSRNVDHIRDNLNILDFTLTDDEMAEIAKLDKGERYYHRTDEQLKQFAGWRPEFEKA